MRFSARQHAAMKAKDDLVRAVINFPTFAARVAQLGAAARPTSDDDYGSERQVAAENEFFAVVEGFLSKAAFQSLEDWCHKASPDERISEAMVAVDAQHARNAHRARR